MDNQSQHSSKRTLPNTARVCDKIIEYYKNFGHDRDLERFMRLNSPASSTESQKTQKANSNAKNSGYCCVHTKSQETTSSTGSFQDLAILPLRPLSVCGTTNSKSLPNIDVHVQNTNKIEIFPAKGVIVDINIETNGDKEKIINLTENLETPKKPSKNMRMQTPESDTKSHRRLEWDSLGDVGYQKSMSTSNISLVEKSLLKEFFKENSVVSEPGISVQDKTDNPSELKIPKDLKTTEPEHSTPPLACSTLVESTKNVVESKLISKSTSSALLQEKYEKYAQTSLIKTPIVHSQEVQCTISSSNSIIEDTATPSSFEYYSSRSSKSRSSRSSDDLYQTVSQRHIHPLKHPFITSITELLIKRKTLGEKSQQQQLNQSDNIREIPTKFQNTLDENKENQLHYSTTMSSTTASSFSLTKQAPELDLGIRLICSLIDAKSVNGRQKTQLIRDVVKRLTRLEIADQTSHSTAINSSSGTTTNFNENKSCRLYDSVRSHISNKQKANMSKLKAAAEIPVLVEQVKTKEKREKPSTSNSNTSEDLKCVLVSKHTKENKVLKAPNDRTTPLQFQQQQNKSHSDKQFPCITNNQRENVKENDTNMSRAAAVATSISKSSQSEKIKTAQRREAGNQSTSPDSLKTKFETLRENKTNRSTQTKTYYANYYKKSSLTSTNTTSSITSQDLVTQKFIAPTNTELNNSNTDAEQGTMGEWLNPLTQSEIEYEKKKCEELKEKAAAIHQEKRLKKVKYDCGREQQLNWIENEIKRLECLKHLLLKDATTEQSSTYVSSLELTSCTKRNFTKDSAQNDKLYDTVYSNKSSGLNESAERLVHEIEVILEESHEDVINVKDNLKRVKDRSKEIQITYEKLGSSKNNAAKPKFRTIKETININEEQLLDGKESEMEIRQRYQREKIDTPSTEESQKTESLKDLVRQRKKEFMEAYKTKKQQHYEALKQQKREDFKYLNTKGKINQRAVTTTTTTDSDHYSIPHTMPRKFGTNDLLYAYTQNPLPLTPTEKELKSHNHSATHKHITYSTTAPQKIIKSTATTIFSSSTSMFYVSSDVSVPMSSHNTTSTLTTTHQYDDVTPVSPIPGIAVQTSDSILCTNSIFRPKQPSLTLLPYVTATTNTNTASVQVKPKGIAYVIEFDDNNKNSNSDSTSRTNINLKTKTKSRLSSTIDITNNLKAFSSSEPQLTLQEHLQKGKPKFVQNSKERKAIINQLQSIRQERNRQIREIIDNTSFNSLEKRLQHLPPPPTQNVHILTTKDMKTLTNKRFSNLPEVVAKLERKIEEKKRRSNRILRDIFSRRLQKRVRSGKLSLNYSRTVI